MPEPSQALLEAARGGSVEALEQLIREQQAYMYSVGLSVAREPEDAADALQEACVRLSRALPSYRAESKFTTWLYRLTVNAALDLLRQRGRAVSLEGNEPVAARLASADSTADPQRALDRTDTAARVRQALERLPAAQRLALTLLYFEDLKYEEIALAMGLPLNTVRSHIRRGKERLAAELADLAPGGLEGSK